MLVRLKINHFAIIEAMDIAFPGQLNILTGRAGAGKSLVLEALATVLGLQPVNKQRCHGGKPTCIEAHFDTRAHHSLLKLLDTMGFEAVSHELVIRREITDKGKSKIWCNEVSTTGSFIKKIAPYLVMMHRQHEHLQLLHPTRQRQLYDQFAETETLYEAVSALTQDIDKLGKTCLEHQSQYEQQKTATVACEGALQALEDILGNHTLREIIAHQAHAAHYEQHLRLLAECQGDLSAEDGSIIKRLYRMQRKIDSLPEHLVASEALQEAFTKSFEGIDALEAELEASMNTLHEQHEQQANYSECIEKLNDLARQWRVPVNQLETQQAQWQQQCQNQRDHEEQIEKLSEQLEQQRSKYQEKIAELNDHRQQALERFNHTVNQWFNDLRLEGAYFQCELAPQEDTLGEVIFKMSTAAGQTPLPLQHCLSGGELSRLALIMQSICHQQDHLCFVYDEIDVGLSGQEAAAIGRVLRRTADQGQALCISHLPQVAACAHHHWLISKTVISGETQASCEPVTGDERIAAVAELVSADDVQEDARYYAQQLVQAMTNDD